MAKIQYTSPEGNTGEIEFTAERMSLGRADDNLLVINDASVSSHHGEVALEGDRWVLTDLGSTNGTTIGGERVERIELNHGSNFELGNVQCVFIGDAVEEADAGYAPQEARTMTATGYGAMPIDRSRRTGFGPKEKVKNPGNGLLIALGVIALLACGAACYMFTQMSA